jgi:hypothetical protein
MSLNKLILSTFYVPLMFIDPSYIKTEVRVIIYGPRNLPSLFQKSNFCTFYDL